MCVCVCVCVCVWRARVCVCVCVCVYMCARACALPTLPHKASLQGFSLPAGVKPSGPVTAPPVPKEQVQADCCPTHAPASALFLPFSRCCQTHDNCYKQAKKLDSCKVLVDNPYTNSYSYSCSNKQITCSSRFTILLALVSGHGGK